jgi:hypothetical protein
MKVSEIILDVRRELLESSAAFWSDAEILRHVNRAEMDYVNKTRILEDKAQLSLIAGKINYPLPSNWLSSRAVFLLASDGSWRRLNPSNLEKTSQESMNFLDASEENRGTPSKYWIWSNELWLDRAPNDETATSLMLFYKSEPIPLENTNQSVNLPDSLSEAATEYVLWKARKKAGEGDRADEHKLEYDRYVLEGRRFVKKQLGDGKYQIDIMSRQSFDGSFHPFSA